MKRTFCLFLACISLCGMPVQAEIKRDTTNVDIREYKEETGYFQKANRDLNDPRFMFHDTKYNIDFGIGGTIEAAAFYGFNGAIPGDVFTPADISVPTDRSNLFGMKVSGSELHTKARKKWKNHSLVGFLKIGFDANNKAELKQAYVSFDGFSVGKIPTFFIDLEFGVMSRLAVSTQADVAQPLFGYTYRHKKGWEVAAALELASLKMDKYSIENVGSSYQAMPDFTAHVKYRWDKGHVQLGGVVRRMTYWAKDDKTLYDAAGKNKSVMGYGACLSGNYKPVKDLTLSAIFTGGRGIAKYMDYCASLPLDLGLSSEMDGTYKVMKSIPLSSAAFSAQYEWNKKFSAAAQVGYARCFQKDGITHSDPFKSCIFTSLNFFYYIKDWAFIGAEYLFGQRNDYGEISEAKPELKGRANRIILVGAFMF